MRIIKLSEGILITEAKGATATAGSAAATQHIIDLARRLCGDERRLRSPAHRPSGPGQP
jgi:hypothetical protein